MQRGYKLDIGPFQTIHEAQNSLMCYQIATQHPDSLIISPEKELYWYKFKCTISVRTHRFILKSDFEIRKGNSFDFIQELKTSFQNSCFLQGPWEDYQFCQEMKPKH
jgi:hypothetical protein